MFTCLNIFPSKNGISSDLLSEAIILGSPNPDYNKLKITFGSYAQVYIGTKKITKKRTVGAIEICLEKEWGGHYFMSLETGKQLHTYIWTYIPISEQVIQRVDEIDTKEKHLDTTKG